MSNFLPNSRPGSRREQDERRKIVESLLVAKDLRADMHLDFMHDGKVLFQGKGACVDADEDTVRIYLRDTLTHTVSRGMIVHAYFTLRSHRKSVPCDFMTTVTGTSLENMDSFLELETPGEMGHNQRRYNVRISLHKEEIDNLEVWIGLPRHEEESTKLNWMRLDREQMELFDISASGLQIAVSRESPVYPYLSRRAVLLLNGNFMVRGKEEPLSIAGNIIRVVETNKKSWKNLGVCYRQWAKRVPENMHWITMNVEEGVSPLASWVFQTIVERAKERGLTD